MDLGVSRRRPARAPRGQRERGAAAVEFALVVPLLLLLLFGIVDFGFLLNRNTVLANAAREGVRAASLGAILIPRTSPRAAGAKTKTVFSFEVPSTRSR